MHIHTQRLQPHIHAYLRIASISEEGCSAKMLAHGEEQGGTHTLSMTDLLKECKLFKGNDTKQFEGWITPTSSLDTGIHDTTHILIHT